jgi:hypothetical protein
MILDVATVSTGLEETAQSRIKPKYTLSHFKLEAAFCWWKARAMNLAAVFATSISPVAYITNTSNAVS